MCRKKQIALAFLLACTLLVMPIVSAVEAPYEGYTYNYWGRSVPTPVTYTPQDTIYGADLGIGGFLNVEDMAVHDGLIYILDSGNGRIVMLDDRFQLVRVMDTFYNNRGKKTKLKDPKGIFVQDDLIYVADSGNSRVIAFDMEGNQKRLLRRPHTTLIDKDRDFTPLKLAVDRGNQVYVQCDGFYQGLMAYNEENRFTGFYGGNQVQLSLSMLGLQFWKSLFNKEQRESLQRAVPVEYSNLYMVGDFVYTCTKKTATSMNEVQKLNPKGTNILAPTASVDYDPSNFGDIESKVYRSKLHDNIFVDIHVDENDVIALLDQERGRVFLYDQECNILGIFGVKGDQRGAMVDPVALDKINDCYLVLDKGKNCLMVYQETEYMHHIREGIQFYADGLYQKSIEPWQKVLQYDSRCTLAYKSIGKAVMQEGNYKAAMDCFEKGQDRQSYSRALREYRREISSKYFFLIVLGVILCIWLLKLLVGLVLRRLGVKKKKTKIRFD